DATRLRTGAGRGVEIGDIEQARPSSGVDQDWAGASQHRRVVAEAGRKVEHAVEEKIVDDVGIVVKTATRANYELSVAIDVPGDAKLRGEVVPVVIRLARERRVESGQQR